MVRGFRKVPHVATALVSIAIWSLAVVSVRAATLSYQDDPLQFGHTDQNSAGINNGGQACGPTSVYNSFVFLQNEYGIDISLTAGGGNSSAVNTINDLAGYMGAPVLNDVDLVNGKEQYLIDNGFSDKVVVESLVKDPNAIPGIDAATFIYNQLKKGQDVEIGFFWSDVDGNKTSGGHWVTVTGINFDTSVGTGTIDLIDPWGGVDITGGNLHLGSDGRLILGYSGGGAGAPTVDGQDPDNPTDSGFGFITGIAAESFVPLPPALWASLVLLGGMVAYRRVRPARA